MNIYIERRGKFSYHFYSIKKFNVGQMSRKKHLEISDFRKMKNTDNLRNKKRLRQRTPSKWKSF